MRISMSIIFVVFFGVITCISAASQSLEYNEAASMPEPEWRLIVGKDWELERFKVVAKRGHPEGRIRNIMKSFAAPSRLSNPDRNLMDFKRLRKNGTGMLETFLMRMQYTPVSKISSREQLVYWVNVRNMLILQAMAEDGYYKIPKLNRGSFSKPSKIWSEVRFEVEGASYSIQDIEIQILKLGQSDPRIIYALYQGSIGGPTLPASGFTAQFLSEQLDETAAHFIGSEKHFKITNSQVIIPAMYGWYKDTLFGGSEANIRAHLLQFSDPRLVAALSEGKTFVFDKMQYEKDTTNSYEYFLTRQDADVIIQPKIRTNAFQK